MQVFSKVAICGVSLLVAIGTLTGYASHPVASKSVDKSSAAPSLARVTDGGQFGAVPTTVGARFSDTDTDTDSDGYTWDIVQSAAITKATSSIPNSLPGTATINITSLSSGGYDNTTAVPLHPTVGAADTRLIT